MKTFIKYTSVGVINTLIHWGIFYLIYALVVPEQSVANLIGFCVSVTFSYFVNAKFTFKSQTSKKRYILFVAFMGALFVLFGYISDTFSFPAILTLVVSSGTSLVLGFVFSKFVVFR